MVPGFFLKRLEDDFKISRLDISEYVIAKARKHTSKSRLFVGSAEALSFYKGQFKYVIAFDLIEHLKKPELFFIEVHSVLSKEGIFIISTPNSNSFGEI